MAILIVGLQEDGTESRRKRQSVSSRDDDGDSHRKTELLIEGSGHATHERHGDEHRGHHQRDGDNSSRNLVHGIDRSRQRTLISQIKLGMHGLNHHDGIVNHDGDSQQQGREYKQVDGEAHQVEEEERTDERYGNGNQRDQRGAPVLQEDVNHEEHQDEREDQGEYHLLDRGEEELRDVHVDAVFQSRWERLCLFLKHFLTVAGNLCGIRASHLLHHTHDRRHTVVAHGHAVGQCTKFDVGYVFQFQRLAAGIT